MFTSSVFSWNTVYKRCYGEKHRGPEKVRNHKLPRAGHLGVSGRCSRIGGCSSFLSKWGERVDAGSSRGLYKRNPRKLGVRPGVNMRYL